MVCRPVFTRALALLIGLPALVVLWSEPAQSAPPPASPLSITITSLTPGQVPANGPIRIRGRVTNRDDVTWSLVNLHPLISATPMTTRAALADAAELPSEVYVGNRIIDVGAHLDELPPGTSSTFSISVPRSLLDTEIGAGAPGVYWFGVHALAQDPNGQRITAGKVRTFLPLVPPSTKGALRTALVVPLRRFLGREEDGSLSDPDAWLSSLSDGGRLQEALAFGAAAGPGRLSWLVDPALPDAVRHLAEGNPPRSLGPTEDPAEPGETISPSPTDEAEEDEEQQPEEEEPPTPLQEAATAWLTQLEPTLRSHELLTLPYGDLDLSAAAEHDPELIDLAQSQVGTTLQQWGLQGSPVVGSPGGYMDVDAMDSIDVQTPVLLSDLAFPGDAPGVADLDGRKLIFASAGASTGGPGPTNPFEGVALRQRILSEAALRVLEDGRRDPLVVVLPVGLASDWAEEFFEGLDVGWVDLTTLGDATDRNGRSITADELTYPDRQTEFELDAETFEAADALIADGQTLQNLLTLNNAVAADVTEQALAGTSYSARTSQLAARSSLNRSRSWIGERLGSIEIGGPPGVTLSSETGDFVATISNRLDQPVTVAVEAQSGNGIEVTPPEPVEVAARSRTSVLLQARTAEASVNNVTLRLTDAEGTPIGSSDQVPIRSAQVSNVIWVIMGAGVVLLFGAILLRLVRRIRRRGREVEEPAPEDTPSPTPTQAAP